MGIKVEQIEIAKIELRSVHEKVVSDAFTWLSSIVERFAPDVERLKALAVETPRFTSYRRRREFSRLHNVKQKTSNVAAHRAASKAIEDHLLDVAKRSATKESLDSSEM